MAKVGRNGRPPSVRDIYCDVLAYLANKPSRTCYDASNPAFIHSIGAQQAHAMMEQTYGKDVVEFTRGFIGPVIDKFTELHPTPTLPPLVQTDAEAFYPFLYAEKHWDAMTPEQRAELLVSLGFSDEVYAEEAGEGGIPDTIAETVTRPFGALGPDEVDALEGWAQREHNHGRVPRAVEHVAPFPNGHAKKPVVVG